MDTYENETLRSLGAETETILEILRASSQVAAKNAIKIYLETLTPQERYKIMVDVMVEVIKGEHQEILEETKKK